MQHKILISGATRGIGRAIAENQARAGNDIIALARSQAELDEMAKSWGRFSNSHLYVLAVDLSTGEGCKKVAAFLSDQKHTVMALINNVGQYVPGGLLQERNLLEDLLAINLLAAHRLTRIILPAMLKRDQGQLITIGSVAALDFPAHMSAYTVSKYALHGWHEALKREIGHSQIKTCLIIPGATLTSAWEGEDYDPSCILPPEQVAAAVAHALNAPVGTRVEKIEVRPPS